MSYLGYKLKSNGGQEAHVRERVKKVMEVMSQVWGIGKRRFRGNWKRRMELFDWLVSSVLGFGAEVWGWKEWEEVGRLQEKYMRYPSHVSFSNSSISQYPLRVDKRTPEYLVREEDKRERS